MVSTVEKYIQRWAEPASLLRKIRCAHDAVVIPSFGEGNRVCQAVDRVFDAAPSGRSVLAIVVVNEPEGVGELDAQANRLSLDKLTRSGRIVEQNDNTWLVDRDGEQLLVTFHRNLTRGVGQARKIGLDLALRLFHEELLASPQVRMTDADAQVADDFWHPLPTGSVAWLFPFEHRLDGPNRDAIIDYELHLRLYPRGLQSAGSPFCIRAVGSTIALDLRSYATVRGMPLKNAAEDFYLLDKLAKEGQVEHLTDRGPIVLSDRLSTRVPFGTGRAMIDATQGRPHQTHRWQSYEQLAQLHREATAFLDDKGPLGRQQSPKLSLALERIRNNIPVHARVREWHRWFGGLKTLQAVKAFDATGIAPVTVTEVAQQAFPERFESAPTSESALKTLRQIDQQEPLVAGLHRALDTAGNRRHT